MMSLANGSAETLKVAGWQPDFSATHDAQSATTAFLKGAELPAIPSAKDAFSCVMQMVL